VLATLKSQGIPRYLVSNSTNEYPTGARAQLYPLNSRDYSASFDYLVRLQANRCPSLCFWHQLCAAYDLRWVYLPILLESVAHSSWSKG
jgi:hypothetical protein